MYLPRPLSAMIVSAGVIWLRLSVYSMCRQYVLGDYVLSLYHLGTGTGAGTGAGRALTKGTGTAFIPWYGVRSMIQYHRVYAVVYELHDIGISRCAASS